MVLHLLHVGLQLVSLPNYQYGQNGLNQYQFPLQQQSNFKQVNLQKKKQKIFNNKEIDNKNVY